jgi:tRNA threonylcarbamoyl adenosine modification protein YeaZ
MDLTLDTSTPHLSMSSGRDGKVATFISSEPRKGNRHLVEGWTAVRRAFPGLPDDLRHIYCTTGPGSFTGVRTGLAFIRGLAIGRAIRLHPVSTLFAMSLGCPDQGLILPLMPAGRDLWYAALYSRSVRLTQKIAPRAVPGRALVRMGRGARVVVLPGMENPPPGALLLTEPLSRILYDHRSLCGPPARAFHPLYLISPYD